MSWMQETNTNFPMYIDSGNSIYNLLGYKGTASITAKVVFKAIKLAFKARSIPALPKADLPKQLGGSMILSREGKILYIHRSETPDDRPTMDQLIRLLPTLTS